MDIITTHDLRKYEEILDEINSEYEKSEELKKEIQQVENKIIFSKLSLSPCRRQISHVNVKVFGSVAEILNLYDVDVNYRDLQSVCKYNCNYFLIEVFLTKIVAEKLVGANWRLQISVCGETGCNNRVVLVGDKNSILEIIPVNANTYECTVDTCLFYWSDEEWNIIDLHTISVDISYYFEPFKEQTNVSIFDNLINITKLYNSNVDLSCIEAPTTLHAQMKCHFNTPDFVAAFLKHSYHRLNLELFSDFVNDDKRVVDLQFSVNNKHIVILYHKDINVLKIKSSPCLMLMMRKFLQPYSRLDYQEIKNRLQKMGGKKASLVEMDASDLCTCYQQLRKLWL